MFYVHNIDLGRIHPLQRNDPRIQSVSEVANLNATQNIHSDSENKLDSEPPHDKHRHADSHRIYTENSNDWLAKDIMSHTLVTVPGSNRIAATLELMNQHEIHHIIVTDLSQALFGIISKEKIYEQQKSTSLQTSQQESLNPLDLMENLNYGDIFSTAPETPAGQVARFMLEYDLSSMAVVENKNLVGIITLRDFLRLSVKTHLNGFLKTDTTA